MKRKILLFTMILTTLFCFACGGNDSSDKVSIFSRPVVEREAGKRKDWNDVSSFVCYYGDFDFEFQSKFDVIIMHSSTLYQTPNAKEEVQRLKDAGCYVVSYITIGEDDSLEVADGMGEGGYASYYVYENGYPKMNVNWNSYFVDAGNPVWQAKIINETEIILSYGVDGIFVDTLDTVDIDNSTLPGMADLVKKLDETFPEAKLVANRGFTVLPYISAHIDGVMFESFNSTIDFETETVADLTEESREWNEDIACNTINAVRRYDYFPIFALDYCNEWEYDYMPIDYYNRSWQYDFIPYSTYDYHLGTPCYPKDANGELLTPTAQRGELALSKLASSELDGFNGDRTTDNYAFADNGTKVTVSSTYNGYNTKALNDGWYATPDNHVQKNWAKESWASTDNKLVDHWIEFEFTEAKEVGCVVVHWANDNGTYYMPKLAIVQAWDAAEGVWVEVARMTNEDPEDPESFLAFEQTWTISFDSVTTTKIRVVQPKGCGAHDRYGDAVRSGIMWVSEVEIFKEAR